MRGVSLLKVAGVATVVAAATTLAEPALTIYNQQFAVVRETVPLDLKKGLNELRVTAITAHLEPDSVMLRDPAGKAALQILEQNYRSDPVSQGLLLSLCEGQTLDFVVQLQNGEQKMVSGKLIRSGYVPHQAGLQRYGRAYYQQQMARAYGDGGGEGQAVVEVDGKVRFGLPGTPLFPALKDDAILKPTLQWVIESSHAGKLDAELCYVTGGMSWEADYNVVAPEQGDVLDLVGWVTMDNQSGRDFPDAQIKLMAGDVSKIQDRMDGDEFGDFGMAAAGAPMAPTVTEKAFDEYHLYTLQRRTTLHDRETKQVEFVRASGIESQRVYVYDGAKIDWRRYQGYDAENLRQDRNYGTQCNPRVWAMREFKNSEANHLGMPLPKGRLRFYRRDNDGQLEFTGENVIDHTPKDETIRVATGDVFDLVGERRRTDFKVNDDDDWLDESFEVKLRNHKKEAVEIRVVEHLYRWVNWEITKSSLPNTKTESQTMEFRVNVKPDEEAVITYTAHYTW